MRPIFATVMALVALSQVPASPAAGPGEVRSPDGRLRAQFRVSGPDRQLTYALTFNGRPVLAPARAGIVIDGADLGIDVEVGPLAQVRDDGRSDSSGGARARSTQARLALTHRPSSTRYAIHVRVFDGGLAFRYDVPGEGRRTPDEATMFRPPSGSVAWYHDLRGHYEGVHVRRAIDQIPAGDWAAPPVTFQLPAEGGYAAITEAALIGYSGMALQADGHGGFRARLAHEHPVGRPFELRYTPEDIKRLAIPAGIDGPIVSPWRVVLVGRDLSALVNARVVDDVSPEADPQLFPKGRATDWIRPGRAVWRFLDGGENTIDGLKQFSDLAAELGFEYHVVEGVWQKWTAEDLKGFVDYSKSRGVGIWLWKDSRAIRDPDARRRFFEQCRALGVVGAKIDFIDHEAKEMIDYYHTILAEAATYRLMVDFHGANKPTGETRTWPNDVTREGIYGLEHRSMEAWARHNTTLPFTRYLAGPGDYTPVVFGERRRETSWAHQIATAAVFNSPLLVYGGNPGSLLENPAVEMIKSIPSVWDETRVLPPSEIGELAILARRRGDTWFLTILNGPAARTLHLKLGFLPAGAHDALLVRDVEADAAAVRIERATTTRSGALDIALRPGGGFIARFTRGTRQGL